MQILGWLIVVAAVIIAYVYYRRSTAPVPPSAGSPPPNRAIALGAGIVAVALALYLFTAAPPSIADLKPKIDEKFASDPTERTWHFNVPGQVGWDPQNQRLLAKMKVGEGWYGVAPVDWEGDAFWAEWDITILSRDKDPQGAGPGAVAAVGMYDNTISNIDDTDHVGGSSILAVFGDTVRLRVSDINLLVKSDVGKTALQTGKTYHARLAYDRRASTAWLQVTEKDSGAKVADLKIEDLRDLSASIEWFGVSMKGFNRNKTKRVPGRDKDGLFIDAAIDNVVYAQP
jgi:hypothetical protein